ncbi:MAG: PAS domain-containing protein [Sulfuritalea sp.]|nr:PAS domain-containing protein [Sulfuritalea sp.]
MRRNGKPRALQLLSTISDSSSDAIFAKDLQGRYLLFNRECARVLGKTAEQALGHDDSALFPLPQAAMIRANDRRVLAEQRINTYEEALSTADGERVYLATKGPLRDADGQVIGLFGISRDITERTKAETELRRNIEQLERFNRVAVDRELDMIRLKQQVNALSRQLGQAPPHALAFVEAPTTGANGSAIGAARDLR